MATKYLSIRELRPKLPSVVRDAAATSARYVVTRRGKPEAVILSLNDYESLMETLDVLSDPRALEALRKGEEDIRKGRARSWAEIGQSIVETLAIERDPKLMAQIRASLRYLRRGGKGIPLEKIDWGRV